MALLTTAEFRAIHPSGLSESALQLLLNAAEAEIDSAYGPVGATLELFRGGGHRLLVLGRAAASITSIVQTRHTTDLTMSADDYLLHPDGFAIERIPGGTNSGWSWWGRVAVTYSATDDALLRKIVQADLVQLMQTYAPGATQETIGAWSESFASNATWNTSLERATILNRLSLGPSLIVVGDR